MLSLLALILSLQDETVVTVEKLRELEASVPPIVERATGKKFAKLPALGVAKRDEVVSVLAEELVPQLKLQYPVLGDETIRGEAKSMARQYARILLAKYSAKHHRIYVLPDTFRELAKRFGRPEIHSAEYLRMIVLHEYVHALDEEQYRAASKLQEMKSTGELEIWNALVEGHAQYVTHRILRSEDQEKLFLDFEDRIAAAPEAEGEADKYLASLMTHFFRWSYVDGKAFFDGLEKSGRKTFVDDAFTKPPTTKAVILHPERYYDPKAAKQPRDFGPMWTELKKLYADEWDFTVRDLDESQMRAAFGDFLDAKRVADCAKGLVGGEVMLLQPRGGGDRLAYVGLYQMESAAAAGKAYDALTELGRAKDKRMTSGSIVITKSEYGALKTRKPGRHEAASKRIDAMGSTIDVRLVVAEFDCYVIEILYSNTPVKDEDLVDCLERVCAFLEKK